MSPYGWMILVVCVGGITGFLIWCLVRVLKNHGKQDHLRTPADLDPRDTDR